MKLRLRRRRFTEAERAQQLVATLTSERDAAYQSGYASGYVDGIEAGLRQVLDDAKAAMGEAA